MSDVARAAVASTVEAPGAVESRGPLSVRKRLNDLVELTKPRITLMVVLTAALGSVLASGASVDRLLLVWTLIGTGLVSAGSATLNHVVEKDADRKMRRTADRPLPTGRMNPDLALLFGVALGISGMLVLGWLVNLLTAALGASALALYVFVYTPLKQITSLNTLVGAVPGAIPPMMGWTAVTDELSLGGWVLFGILFFWQMPHFLAIAWMCREDYERAGMPMLTVSDESGSRTMRQMLGYCAALLPVSLMPTILGLAGTIYFVATLVLGIGFLAFCLRFWRDHSHLRARQLLLYSVLYLPAVLIAMVFDRVTP